MSAAITNERTVTQSPSKAHLQVGPPVKLSWGAIFGGAVTALALWAMLYALGLALGLSNIDPADDGSLKTSGVFTGIWGLIAPLVALFVGGMVASRGAGVMTKTGGALHGLVMWGLTTLAGAWLLTNILSGVIGGVATAGKSVVQAGAGAVSSAVGQASGNTDAMGNAADSLGLNADDALRPVNQRLAAEGKPAVSAAALQAAAKDVLQEGVRQGRFDRELLVSNLAQNSQLSRTDAEDVATRVESQFNTAKAQVTTRVEQAAQSAKTGALKAADATGKIFWGIFGALILGMAAALFGATFGVSKRQRVWADSAAGVTPPLAGREVYP